jgi:hypothetical protein
MGIEIFKISQKGIAGNIGQALSAIPIGLFIDSNGARLAAMIGVLPLRLATI